MCREAGFVYLGEESDGKVTVQVPANGEEVSFEVRKERDPLNQWFSTPDSCRPTKHNKTQIGDPNTTKIRERDK